MFTEEVTKIALSANDDNRIQSINSREAYAYGMGKDLICKKKEIEYNNTIMTIQYKAILYNNTKMINFDCVRKENIKNIIQISHEFLIIHTEY